MNKKQFLKTFIVFFIIGMIGVILLIPTIIPLLEQQLQSIPNPPEIPFAVLVLISLANPAILLILSIIVGLLTAPKAGLVSYLHLWLNDRLDREDKSAFKKSILSGVLSGLVVAVILFGTDRLLQPYLPAGLQSGNDTASIWATVSGVFYGGITEEIMMRWGMMSLLVFGLWKIFQRRKAHPSSAILWISVFISSLLFAVGHIGATAMVAPLTPIVLIRMMFLNSIGGIVFGWLYWKKGLEIAMVAHGYTHITMAVISFFWFL